MIHALVLVESRLIAIPKPMASRRGLWQSFGSLASTPKDHIMGAGWNQAAANSLSRSGIEVLFALSCPPLTGIPAQS